MTPRDIILIYCICDDFTKGIGVTHDMQARMTQAEVMTVAFVAARYFAGRWTVARLFLKSHGYLPTMLGYSRLCRRIHQIPKEHWQIVLYLLSRVTRQSNEVHAFSVDSFPIPACLPCRSRVCQLYQGKEYLGYCASKKMHYFGLKAHLIITIHGEVVEFFLTPASVADIRGLELANLDLPKFSTLYADRAYTSYGFEDDLYEMADISLVAERKRNAKRQHSKPLCYIQKFYRKRIESAISEISSLMPRHIAAHSSKGFELRLFLFVTAYMFKRTACLLSSSAA
jgi:hypothetical protein